jgi:GR25 family glycosyltransferase involved in LPS biosynthesis
MKSFCISLETQKEKWPNLIQNFKSNNIKDITIFEAINGKEIEHYFNKNMSKVSPFMKNLIESFGGDTMISSWALYQLLQKSNRRDHAQLGTFGAVGCYLSHILLWKKMISENWSSILIFEDDVELYNNFSSKIDNIFSNMPEDTDFLFLGTCKNLVPKPYNEMFNKVAGSFYGLHGYVITNNAAKKLMKYLFPIEVQIDWMISFQNIYNKLNLYSVTPEICKQKSHISSIQAHCYICQFSENEVAAFNILFFVSIVLIIIMIIYFISYIVLKYMF